MKTEIYDYLADMNDEERRRTLNSKLIYAMDGVLYYTNDTNMKLTNQEKIPYEQYTVVPEWGEPDPLVIEIDTDIFLEPKDRFTASPFSVEVINSIGLHWLATEDGSIVIEPHSTLLQLMKVADAMEFDIYVLEVD